MSIELLNETDAKLDEARIIGAVRHVLASLHVHPDAEVSIVLVDAAAIEQLHVQWLDIPGPTDVLSFPMDELRPGSPEHPTPPGMLGDIVLCPEVAAEQASEAGHETMHEVLLLTVHSTLHLLGYDHAEADEKREMFELQDRLLAEFEAADA
ncbi:rRNA maturation RNase YbeY [Agrococcus casei]|uniref:rRNA maturation RNase YbeY n=1 Tax=Agrococcus casei TaxID=343512 RepID=UPI003F8EF6E6